MLFILWGEKPVFGLQFLSSHVDMYVRKVEKFIVIEIRSIIFFTRIAYETIIAIFYLFSGEEYNNGISLYPSCLDFAVRDNAIFCHLEI